LAARSGFATIATESEHETEAIKHEQESNHDQKKIK
jgi:hypothetical protein